MQINSEETKYKEEVSKQIEMISNLNDESSKIKLQVKDKEQVIRILSLKLKEISGIHLNKFQNKREESIGSYKSNKPFTKIKLSNSQNNVKDDIGRLSKRDWFILRTGN